MAENAGPDREGRGTAWSRGLPVRPEQWPHNQINSDGWAAFPLLSRPFTSRTYARGSRIGRSAGPRGAGPQAEADGPRAARTEHAPEKEKGLCAPPCAVALPGCDARSPGDNTAGAGVHAGRDVRRRVGAASLHRQCRTATSSTCIFSRLPQCRGMPLAPAWASVWDGASGCGVWVFCPVAESSAALRCRLWPPGTRPDAPRGAHRCTASPPLSTAQTAPQRTAAHRFSTPAMENIFLPVANFSPVGLRPSPWARRHA